MTIGKKNKLKCQSNVRNTQVFVHNHSHVNVNCKIVTKLSPLTDLVNGLEVTFHI